MLLQKIKKLAQNQQHLVYFLFYSLCYILVGQLITCIGPMIPYLAESKGMNETQYSIFFIGRGLGYVIGAFFTKIYCQKFILHHLIGLGLGLSGVFSILFIFFDGAYTQTLLIFLGSLGIFFIDTNVNYSAIQFFKGENLSMWLQIIYGSFGIGGLTGPLVVYLFQNKTLAFLGCYALAMGIFSCFLQSPQILNKQNQEIQKEEFHKPPNKSLIMMKLVFLLVVGEQICYGAWISTFAVSNKYSSKQHATLYSFLFWVFVTVFRFILALFKGSSIKKIKNLAILGMTTVILCSLIILAHPETGLIGMSIILGICNSSMFPLLFLVFPQGGYKLTAIENSSLIIWAYLGEGALPMIMGVLIDFLSYNWFLYGIFLINLGIVVTLTWINNVLVKDKQQNNKPSKLQRLISRMDISQDIRVGKQIQMVTFKK